MSLLMGEQPRQRSFFGRHLPPMRASGWWQSFGSPANSGGVPWLCGPASRRGCLSREGLLSCSTNIDRRMPHLESTTPIFLFVVLLPAVLMLGGTYGAPRHRVRVDTQEQPETRRPYGSAPLQDLAGRGEPMLRLPCKLPSSASHGRFAATL